MQMAAMFYNSANYGIPLMTLAFPQVGAVFQVFIVLVQNLTTFTVGLFLANSAHRSGWRALLPMLRQASIWAIIAAIAVRLAHVPVQQWRWLWVPLGYFSDGLVAMALITLGVQLSKTEHRQPLGRISWALALRLLIGWALVPLFGFTGEIARIMIVSTSFPTAVNTALLAHEFKADAHFAAAAVFYSTMASMFTVTLLVALVRVV
jgi:malate permease and related proteins